MIFSAVACRLPAFRPLVLACAFVCSAATLGAHAAASADPADAAGQTLATVNVLGARFAGDPALLPIGATVITADDMRRAGVTDANAALRKLGGVYGRQSLDGSADFALDLRGFGTNSGQNLVVMLDGVRLSENDLGGAVLSTIPLETIERIEIIRGGASVLFGDGATGGVIQIVTRRTARNTRSAMLRAEAGQFGLVDLRARLAQSWERLSIDAAVSALRTDNYRRNNAFEQKTFSGGAAWRFAGGRAGLRLDSARQQMRFPGSLSLAQFEDNPRQSLTLKDFGAFDADRVTAFAEQRVGAFDLAVELSRRSKTVDATYFDYFSPGNLSYPSHYESEQTQFSPRLRHLAQAGGVLNEVVAGLDLTRWKRDSGLAPAITRERQNARAVYLRDELRFDGPAQLRLAAGLRRENISKDDVGPYATLSDDAALTAWELSGSVDPLPALTVFAKAGRSFRIPTADENGFRQPTAGLKPQTSRDLELGVTSGSAQLGATARLFRHALTDEIFYDPTLGDFGANTNLDPTERRGVELELHAALTGSLRLVAHLQHVKARFTAGVNDGRQMVLVPDNIASARLSWTPATGHSADLGVQWVDRQRYGSDFANDCGGRMPSAATVDGRYARQLGPWELAIAGLNLGGRQHFSQAFACRGAIYSSDGRQIKLSARYDF